MIRVLAAPFASNRRDNPYTYLLYSNMQADVRDFSRWRALTGNYDVVHLHWPEWAVSMPGRSSASSACKRLFANLDRLQRRGAKVFWTVHNLAPHERRHPDLEGWFYDELTSRLSGYFSLSHTGLRLAQQKFPRLAGLAGTMVPHGHYRDEHSETGREDSRRALGLPQDCRVFLYFGKIRAYKNVPALADAFSRTTDPSYRLVIAGSPDDGQVREQLVAIAASEPRITLMLERADANRVSTLFAAADLVALPYAEILNSGAALLALSLNRPVLVPDKGSMSELQQSVGNSWVRTFAHPITSATLAETIQWATVRPQDAVAPLDELDWTNVAARTLAAYQRAFTTLHDTSTPARESSGDHHRVERPAAVTTTGN